MSERDRVMGYLSERFHRAWNEGRDAEAQNYHRFYCKLEKMSDEQYDDTYRDTTGAVA